MLAVHGPHDEALERQAHGARQRLRVIPNGCDVPDDRTPPELPAEPVVEVAPVDETTSSSEQSSRPAPTGTTATACMRHTGSEWRSIGNGMSLGACVQALYAGTCVRPGEAQYGRWGDTTLRLVPRRVEQSNDNTRFRTLAQQDRNCQFPELGR